MIMPTPGIRWSKTKSLKIAFQFASGRTQIHVVVTGASGDQMVSFFVFGSCGWVLWASSAEPSALVCKVDDDYSGHGDIYLALPSNPWQDQMTQMRLKGLDAKAGESFGAEYPQADCYSGHSQALSGGQGWTGVQLFWGTFQETAVITDALSAWSKCGLTKLTSSSIFPGMIREGGIEQEDYL